MTEISDFAAASATGSGSFDGHIRPGFAFGALPARASSTLHRTAASKCDMPDLTLMALCCGLLLATRAQELTPDAILAQYVRAIGGEAALRAVSTRVSSGRFANDRGVNVAFLTIEKAPNKRVTVIGAHPIGDAEGSGRGNVSWLRW